MKGILLKYRIPILFVLICIYTSIQISAQVVSCASYGTWNSTTWYFSGNRVVFNGRLYQATSLNRGNTPDITQCPPPGTSYWTSIGSCSKPATCDATYCRLGNATEIANDCIELTNNLGQHSAVWNTSTLNLNNPFDYFFSVNLGSDDNGADGMAFTFQNNSAGTSTIGAAGGDLGIGTTPNSLNIEFDTYFNSNRCNEIPEDHIAINRNGDVNNPLAGPVQASSFGPNIEDGFYHLIRITWDPGSQQFNVYFDTFLRLSYTNDIINTIFGGNPNVYWGFTASTGGLYNVQSICPGSLPGISLPLNWVKFSGAQQNSTIELQWQTAQEVNTDKIHLLHSQDGKQFDTITTLKANNNNESDNRYSAIDEHPFVGANYYRLLQTDFDGTHSFSPIVYVEYSSIFHEPLMVFPNPTSTNQNTSVYVSCPGELSVLNHLGQVIFTKSIENAGQYLLPTFSNHASFYHITFRHENGINHKQLFVAQ